jgi:small subunit ribosomal protein S18
MAMEQEVKDTKQEQHKVDIVDYKDVKYLTRFISERGKIIPSRINLQPIKKQREISKAIKRARILALLPFVVR